MGVLTITRIPLKGGKKQEMAAPVYQGTEVKLMGDGSSHHYKDPSWEMGVLTITRIPLKGGKKQEMIAPVY